MGMITLHDLRSFVPTRSFVFAYFLWFDRFSFGTIHRRLVCRIMLIYRIVAIVIAIRRTVEMSHH